MATIQKTTTTTQQTGFIPVTTPGAIANTMGSPNQGAFIPTGPGAVGAGGYIVSKHGEKGHHTVIHPVIYQQAPAPAPIVVMQPPPQPQPVYVQQQPAQPPQQQQPEIHIKVNNVQPEAAAQQPTTINNSTGAAAVPPQVPPHPAVTQQTTTTTSGSVYDPANGATTSTTGNAGSIPRQTNTTSTTTTHQA